MADDDFYTLNGYLKKDESELSASGEDYIEMIYRISRAKGADGVKTGKISELLHVKPSSVTKMTEHLSSLGYVNAKKYGEIILTEKGRKKGAYLIYRHRIISEFLHLIGGGNELEETEKIEHFLSPETVGNIEALCKKIRGQTLDFENIFEKRSDSGMTITPDNTSEA